MLNDPKCQKWHWKKHLAFSLYEKNHKSPISFKGVHMINDLFLQWFGSPSSCWAQTETPCGLAVEPASPSSVSTLSMKTYMITSHSSLGQLSAPPSPSLSVRLHVRLTSGGPASATPQPQSCGPLVRHWIVISDDNYAKTKKRSPQQNLLVLLFALTDTIGPAPPSSQGHGDTRRKCNRRYKKPLAWKWTHALPCGINAAFSQVATMNTLLKVFLIFPRSVL